LDDFGWSLTSWRGSRQQAAAPGKKWHWTLAGQQLELEFSSLAVLFHDNVQVIGLVHHASFCSSYFSHQP
jgi:hypothetical protein